MDLPLYPQIRYSSPTNRLRCAIFEIADSATTWNAPGGAELVQVGILNGRVTVVYRTPEDPKP
jgi:hypothetical protein